MNGVPRPGAVTDEQAVQDALEHLGGLVRVRREDGVDRIEDRRRRDDVGHRVEPVAELLIRFVLLRIDLAVRCMPVEVLARGAARVALRSGVVRALLVRQEHGQLRGDEGIAHAGDLLIAEGRWVGREDVLCRGDGARAAGGEEGIGGWSFLA
jgi:hypothetical protein